MIELYSWPTPNGHKIHIMLEETGLDYEVHPVNIAAGEQFRPEFLKICPNHRIPAIIDRDGPGGQPVSVFESGAILMYLGDKAGRFYPDDVRKRIAVHEWLMFQMANVGPMFGQAGHFLNYAPEKIEYAVERYTNEARRLLNVLDRRLGESDYLAGTEYTIADIATFPWVHVARRFAMDEDEQPNVVRWLDAILARPAVKRGLEVLADQRREGPVSEEARRNLFGDRQYQKR